MDKYKQHQNLVNKTKLALQKEFGSIIRIKDRHVGKFVPLAFFKQVKDGKKKLHDYNKNIIAINSKGMSDLYGFISLHSILIHLEFEIKTGKAVQTKEQKEWQALIEKMGGFYCLVRDENQAVEDLKTYLRSRKLIS